MALRDAQTPRLIAALRAASRDRVHLSDNLDYRDAAPRKIVVPGRRVRLGGYHAQDPLTVSVSDDRHNDTAELLMIAPDIGPAVAPRALELAGRPAGTDRAAALLERAESASVPVAS